jgi:hypothetical protein
MRFCKNCGDNLLTTNNLDEAPRPAVNIGWAAFFLAAATIAIVLGGFGIITNFVRDLMTPTPWAPNMTDFRHNIPVAIPMIVLGSATILTTVFFMMKIFSRIMNLPPERKSSKQQNPPLAAYRQPPQIQQPPPAVSSVTEHTTRNFEPIPMREKVIHE